LFINKANLRAARTSLRTAEQSAYWFLDQGASEERFLFAGEANSGVNAMCDYSLEAIRSRAAKVGDKLTTRDFGTGTRGFAASEDANVAVCLMPGTELSFEDNVVLGPYAVLRQSNWQEQVNHKTAIFRETNQEHKMVHHDALEFSDGRVVRLTFLGEGQKATVLQLPAARKEDEKPVVSRQLETAGS
jgi:hypothetical protein